MINLNTNADNQNNENKKSPKKIYNLQAEKLIRSANDSFIYFKDYEMALMQAQQALELDPGNTKAFLLKGTVFFCLDELDTALEYFEKALEADPHCVEAYSLKANILDIKGDLKEALAFCNKAFVSVTRKNCDILTSLFDQKLAILIKSKKYREARATLKQCYNFLKEEDSSYLSSCYRDIIDNLYAKREKKRLVAVQRLQLIHS